MDKIISDMHNAISDIYCTDALIRDLDIFDHEANITIEMHRPGRSPLQITLLTRHEHANIENAIETILNDRMINAERRLEYLIEQRLENTSGNQLKTKGD